MASAQVTINVVAGPALRAVMDVADIACELLELIPEWHEAERAELQSRMKTAADVLEGQLRKADDG